MKRLAPRLNRTAAEGLEIQSARENYARENISATGMPEDSSATSIPQPDRELILAAAAKGAQHKLAHQRNAIPILERAPTKGEIFKILVGWLQRFCFWSWYKKIRESIYAKSKGKRGSLALKKNMAVTEEERGGGRRGISARHPNNDCGN